MEHSARFASTKTCDRRLSSRFSPFRSPRSRVLLPRSAEHSRFFPSHDDGDRVGVGTRRAIGGIPSGLSFDWRTRSAVARSSRACAQACSRAVRVRATAFYRELHHYTLLHVKGSLLAVARKTPTSRWNSTSRLADRERAKMLSAARLLSRNCVDVSSKIARRQYSTILKNVSSAEIPTPTYFSAFAARGRRRSYRRPTRDAISVCGFSRYPRSIYLFD